MYNQETGQQFVISQTIRNDGGEENWLQSISKFYYADVGAVRRCLDSWAIDRPTNEKKKWA